MTQPTVSASDLLEQILNAGRDFANTAQTRSGELSQRGKELAAKGEDVLVDKLGIDDTEDGREALRKGVGIGAAAGALALILSSRSGRKLAGIGGLAGLGLLAYRAYEKNGGKMPNWKDETAGHLSGPKADARHEALLRAMVAAAKADGDLSPEEVLMIGNASDDTELVKAVLSQRPNPEAIAALSDSEQAAREIYAVSCRIADGVDDKQRAYLDKLALALKLDPDIAARIETDVRTG